MHENKIKIVIYIILLTLIASVSLVVFYLTSKKNIDDIHEPINEDYKYSEIYDINEYQMVYNAINDYFNYINNDLNSLFDVLHDEYKSKNNITINNMEEYVEKKYDYFSYTIENINKYYNPYFAIYYVGGNYSLETLDKIEESLLVKEVLIHDILNDTYAIIPILDDNEDFIDILKKYSLENYSKEINSNSHNKINVVNVTEFNEANLYFNDFINKLMDDCNKAYLLLNEKTKIKYKNLDEFNEMCTFYTMYPTISSYEIKYDNSIKEINITDNFYKKYSFLIESVKKYTVNIIN